MSATAQDLADYVGTTADSYLGDCLATAQQLVADAIATSPLTTVTVPSAVVDRAVLEVGSELFHRRNAPNGIAQFATTDGAPIRIARDPMVAARPILAPYLGGGFA